MADVTSLADLLFGGDDDVNSLLLHAGGVDHTLSDVRDRATQIADRLRDAGAQPGAPIGVMLPNADVVAALFAVWRVDGAYVPLNPRLGASDLAHVIGAVEPSIVVTTAEHVDRFAGDRPIVLLAGEGATLRPGTAGDRRFDPKVALVQLTSGTTGRPKPVLLEHAGVLALLDNVIATLRRGPGTSGRPTMPNLIPVSLSLWSGIYQVLFARLAGAPVVVMDAFDPHEFVQLVDRFQIRSTVLPPAAMTMLSDDESITSLAPLKYVRSITSPLSPLQARRFRDRFGLFVLNGYGQTEIGGEIVGWSAADAKAHGDDKLGAVGRPHAGVEVRTDTSTGELQVRTPALSAGYADGTDLRDRLTSDGWFRTGDVGHQDDDGFVWIEGRLSDVINRGGLKVFPAEVEEVLRLAPDIADVAVVGIADERVGEIPVAFVVTTAVHEDGRPPDESVHRRWEVLCREQLAAFKVPVRFDVVDSLPRNEVGKVLAAELVERGAQG